MNMVIPEGLPPHAKQVYRGQKIDIWQWDQSMFDGSGALFERAVCADSVVVIPAVGDRILIQNQEQPFGGSFISLPGGVCEGKDLLADASRELQEETGYTSNDWIYYMVGGAPPSKMIWKNHYYIARSCERHHDPSPDTGEKISLGLISFDDFLSLADDPNFRHKDFIPTMLRARYVPEKRRELRGALFGSS